MSRVVVEADQVAPGHLVEAEQLHLPLIRNLGSFLVGVEGAEDVRLGVQNVIGHHRSNGSESMFRHLTLPRRRFL